MAVRIVTDSSCDLDTEETGALEITVVPLSIRFGEQEFVDREELSPQAFYEHMAINDALPETAAPSPGRFEETFRSLAADGADAIVCINISRDLSATMEAAQQAARAIGDDIDIRVVDSKSITAGLGSLVVRAAQAAQDGRTADQIEEMLTDRIARTRVFGALDTLDNLKKGGRIGGAQALIGTMLSIKPIIDISTGVVEEASKQRTRRKALAWLRSTLAAAGAVEDLAVMHGMADGVDAFIDEVRSEHPDRDIRVGIIGPVVGTHGGPGVVGLCWVDP